MAVWGGGFCHGFSSVVVDMGAGRCGYRWHLKPPVGTLCHALSTRATTSYNLQKWVFTFIFEYLYLPIVNTAIAAHQTGRCYESQFCTWTFMTKVAENIVEFRNKISRSDIWKLLAFNSNQDILDDKILVLNVVVSSLFCCWLKFLMWQGGDDLPILSSTHFLTQWGGDDLPVMLSTHEKKVVTSFIHFMTQWGGDHLSVHLNFF